MSIAKLLEEHRALLDEADRSATFGAVTAAQVRRPLELQEQRVAAIKRRIEALEASKQEYASRVDETVKALREDLAGLERQMASDRDTLGPIVKAIEGGRPGPSGGDTTTPTRPGRQAKGRRQSKDDEA